jgi:uracil-DNA glycosylase
MREDLRDLLGEVAATAKRLRMPVDRAVYAEARRDAAAPIWFAGSLRARVCIVGRDLGREEVLLGQPLVGRAGRAVRLAVLRSAGGAPRQDDVRLDAALSHVLLTNLVPYKPKGNLPFTRRIREGFRPFMERLLVCHFKGNAIVTLGRDAFFFAPYGDRERFERCWRRDARRALEIVVRIPGLCGGRRVARRLTVVSLPHPSPANTRWAARFPELCERCLASQL